MAKGTKTGGRVPGSINRFTSSMKEAFLQVFADLQDEEGGENAHLKKWARDNPTDYYRLCGKMIPQQINADIRRSTDAKDMTDDELDRLIAELRGRKKGAKSSKSVVH